ncbi:type II toxin-antitoxin system HicA family toxin [Phormidesmis priestleyi]|uniref:type II toxin-antitoxin system HicA family toxin n=1 Tax=Phormidesmis priestleyi TaxID=268141 RepID=UPI00083A10FA|nr:type II toxin-antitoxin system HicA family toxin [Phormidesmis priestleyi]
MKLPRDLDGNQLAQALSKFGYEIIRQTGSHIRLTTQQQGKYYITIPSHSPLKVGTLNAILKDVADHSGMSRDALLSQLF